MTTTEAAPAAEAASKPARRRSRLLVPAGIAIVLLASATSAVFFVPGVKDRLTALAEQALAPPPQPAPVAVSQVAARPTYLDLPEMSVTLPNAGHPKQLRIRMSIELSKTGPALPPTESISPRVYDALLIYLRTLSESETNGALAMDRIRSDVHRRLDLVLGDGVVRDVLITSLVVG